MLFTLHFSAHVRWKYSKSYDKKSWYRSFPSLYSMLDLSFRQWPVDPGYLLILLSVRGGMRNYKAVMSGFLFICRIKKRNPRNLKTHLYRFRWKWVISVVQTLPTLTILGGRLWSFTHRQKKHHLKSVVAKKLRFRCYQGVLCCVCFVLFLRWWDFFWPPKIKETQKRG